MSATDLITCLPVSLSCEVLSRWLEPMGLSLLDSAYCSTSLRPRVAALYVADEFVLDQCVRPSTEPRTLPWLLKMKIKASSIEVDNLMDVSSLSNYLQHLGNTVRNVALIDDSAPDTMAVIAQYCTNLTRFSCVSVLIEEHKNTSMSFWSAIPTLRSWISEGCISTKPHSPTSDCPTCTPCR